MQIVPSISESLLETITATAQSNPDGNLLGSGFADVLAEAQGGKAESGARSGTGRRMRLSLQSSARAGRNALREAMASASQDNDPSEKSVRASDVARLVPALRKLGLSDNELAELSEDVRSGQGQRWGTFLKQLASRLEQANTASSKVDLDDDNKRDILAFLQQIGFTENKAEGLLSQLEQGKAGQVFSAIRDQLATLPQDSTFSLHGEQLLALGKALGLSEDATAQLQQIVGQAGRSEFSASELQAAMTLLSAQAASQGRLSAEAAAELKDALGSIFDEMGLRPNLPGDPDETAKVIHASKDEQAAARFTGKSGGDDGKGKHKTEAGLAQELKDAKHARESRDDDQNLHGPRVAKTGQMDNGKAFLDAETDAEADLAGDDDSDDWRAMLERILRGERSQSSDARYDAAQAAQNQGQSQAAQSAQSGQSTQAGFNQAEVLRQVSEGIYKNLGQGIRQLTLQLEPEHLGSLQVVLQVKGKEVRALIRTETQDAHHAISEQMHQVREALEAQGLKVAELDVQTGLSGEGQAQEWFGAEHHNAQTESEALASMRTRMRTLRAITSDTPLDASAANPGPWTHQGGLNLIA